MAILGQFEVAVSINGQRAAEYDDDDSETKTAPNSKVVTKYVEAVAGATFAIDISLNNGYTFDCDYISFSVHLDGTYMIGRVMTPDRLFNSKVEGVQVSEYGRSALRKFKFSDLAISEADDGNVSSLSENKIRYLGMIRVEVWRYKLRHIDADDGSSSNFDTGEDSVPEKALKGRAVTLAAGLDKGVPSRGSTLYSGDKIDSAPVASFQFKYRSRKALQALLIVPRSPSPVSLEDRPIEELSAEEARELLRRQKETQDQQRQIKLEKGKRPRAESMVVPSRSYKVARTEDGVEVVDLADDSDDQDAPGPSDAPANGTTNNENGVEIVDLQDFDPEA